MVSELDLKFRRTKVLFGCLKKISLISASFASLSPILEGDGFLVRSCIYLGICYMLVTALWDLVSHVVEQLLSLLYISLTIIEFVNIVRGNLSGSLV